MDNSYTWLDELLDATKESESPLRFKLWAALYAIAASTKRKVYLNMRGMWKTYPNLYVMIIAESGLGKQFPVSMVNKLLRGTGAVRVVAGRNSIEGIIETVGKAATLPSGTVIKFAEAAIISDEFANLLVDNTSAMTILTQLYDTDSLDVWDNTLRKGQDRLRNVFINLFAATNMEHFNNRIQEYDIKGGFIARTICIHETEVGTLNSLMGIGTDIDWSVFCKRLIEISQLSGEFTMTKDAQLLYDAWYYPFHKEKHNDKTGFVNRVRTHILKVAMCLTLIERNDLIIEEKHVHDAMDLVLPVIDDVVVISRQSGKSKYKSHYAVIIQELMRAPHHMVRRRELLNRHRGEFTAKELNESIETLIQGGNIETVTIDEELGYRLTQRAREELKQK